jgi:GNAT superfamily N-acetyltransferase
MHPTIALAKSDEHLDFIAKHFEETIALWEDYQVTPESVQKRKDQIQEWATEENAHLTVAITPEHQIVGFNSLFITKDYSGNALGKIVILYVLPEHRGTGIAAVLKRDGESWLRSKGVNKVITEIDAKNERMLEINRKAGLRIKSYTFEKEI